LDIDMGAAMRAEDTVVNPMALTQDEGAKVDDEIVDIGAVDADALEFDVQLTDSTILGQPLQAPSFDMGSINLDLAAEAAPAAAPAAPAAAPAPAAADDSIGVGTQWEAVSTKLDLAKAYEEMGDLEGARELLQEVLSEGSPALAEQAQAILARIGG
ncbi:MAG TPA: FimV/HubP family polar landmark protein, partial [Rhodocyclaceae bacterium]|nr:FimV/HubP family polar landmark protein [Rhodocyclaceae bacterium]